MEMIHGTIAILWENRKMLSQSTRYYLPEPSHWPVVGSCALFLLTFGGVLWMNAVGAGPWVVIVGIAIMIYMMFGWFGTVIRESEGGKYNTQVDLSFRWSMSWFIFSEVMFFAAFFGALFYMRVLSVPGLASSDTMQQIWPGFAANWPISGPGIEETFTPMGAWGIPAINTLILLSSGVTVTWAHWALKKNNRTQLIAGLIATVALGILFLTLQAYEYVHAYHELVPGRFLELSKAEDGGPVWQNLTVGRYVARTGLQVQPVVVQQQNDLGNGLLRSWDRPDFGIAKHYGYAVQWFSFCGLIIFLYVFFHVKCSRSKKNQEDAPPPGSD
jgi:cytochrome c oxidase subunit 3